MRHIIILFAERPKLLFFTDAIGAFLSAIFLYLILMNFSAYFGMPELVLQYLSAVAVLLCLYSSLCYLFLKRNWRMFINLIGIANLMYCLLTSGLVIINYSYLTKLGLVYFLGEMLIICGLAYVELTVAKSLPK